MHWAHLEQVLLSCLSSDDIDVRSKGIVTILKIREGKTQHDKRPKRKKKGNHGIRTFEIPSFCYDAQDFTTMTDWQKEQMTEPPFTARMSNEEIKRFELHPLVLDVPSNSQHVERFIRVTTEIGTKSADSTLRDGMVHATVAHRELRGKKESKMDFSKPAAQ